MSSDDAARTDEQGLAGSCSCPPCPPRRAGWTGCASRHEGSCRAVEWTLQTLTRDQRMQHVVVPARARTLQNTLGIRPSVGPSATPGFAAPSKLAAMGDISDATDATRPPCALDLAPLPRCLMAHGRAEHSCARIHSPPFDFSVIETTYRTGWSPLPRTQSTHRRRVDLGVNPL